MLLEVKVALNFIVSYLYNKLPRRRADLFGEELERLLVARFQGHWYPEAPLRGSAFRCLHLGAPRDPLVELAARRSGLDTEEVRANVPAELSVWVDPYEVSYQIGETGALKVLYLEDPPPGPGGGGGAPGEEEEEPRGPPGFNPDARVFVPVAVPTPPPLGSLSGSPTPGSAPPPLPGPALFSYPAHGSTPPTHSSNPSTPSPPYLPPGAPPGPPGPRAPPLPPITFTTASFAATKFGSTKMKKSSGGGAPGGPGGVAVVTGPPQRVLSRSPPPPERPLALQALGGPALQAPPSQLSPNAKEFVFPGPQGPLYFEAEPQPLASPFQTPPHPFSRPAPPPGGGEGLGGYGLQYPSQAFQPVVLAN